MSRVKTGFQLGMSGVALCACRVALTPLVQTAVYPVLAALASYNRSLDPGLQKQLIKCFECGLLVSSSNQVGGEEQEEEHPQVCVVALTACILEMSSSMYALLPEVTPHHLTSSTPHFYHHHPPGVKL